MALFKNLYIDLSFLNPFKKKSKTEQEKPSFPKKEMIEDTVKKPVEIKTENETSSKKKELPEISKKLLSDLDDKNPKNLELPKISSKVPVPVPVPINTAAKNNHSTKDIVPSNTNKYLHQEKKVEAGVLTNHDKKITESFFSSLQNHITKEEAYIHSNLSKDVLYNNLFNEMKSFWQDKKYNINKEMLDNAVKNEISNKIIELQNMEVEWQRLQLDHERLKDELASKEILIESRIKNLKQAFKKIHLSAHTHPDHHFVLSNGSKLRSMQELSDELLVMDDHVFNSHVNQNKNDFANWVNDVMGLKELSQNIRYAKNKEHMSSILKNWHETP